LEGAGGRLTAADNQTLELGCPPLSLRGPRHYPRVPDLSAQTAVNVHVRWTCCWWTTSRLKKTSQSWSCCGVVEARGGGGVREREPWALGRRRYVSLRLYIRRIRSEADLGQGCWNERCGSGGYCRPQARRM